MPLSFTRDADIEAMFADSPHTITIGETTKPCLFDEPDVVETDADRFGGIRQSRDAVATVQTSAYPAPAKGTAVTVTDGVDTRNFTVWAASRIDDGALTAILLRPTA